LQQQAPVSALGRRPLPPQCTGRATVRQSVHEGIAVQFTCMTIGAGPTEGNRRRDIQYRYRVSVTEADRPHSVRSAGDPQSCATRHIQLLTALAGRSLQLAVFICPSACFILHSVSKSHPFYFYNNFAGYSARLPGAWNSETSCQACKRVARRCAR